MKKKVFTGADIEALLKAGKTAADIPAGAILTPSAKDVLRDGLVTARGVSAAPAKAPAEPILPDYEYHWTPGKDPKTPAEIEAFFNSPAIVELKQGALHFSSVAARSCSEETSPVGSSKR